MTVKEAEELGWVIQTGLSDSRYNDCWGRWYGYKKTHCWGSCRSGRGHKTRGHVLKMIERHEYLRRRRQRKAVKS